MKNLKSILCGVFVFIFGAILLTGCSFDNSGNPKKDNGENEINSQYDSVAVAEAKDAIINALVVDDGVRFGYDNRNMYEKFGKFTARIVSGPIVSENIVGECRDGRFVKEFWPGDESESYLDGNNNYIYDLSNQSVRCVSLDDLPSWYIYSLTHGGALDETKLFTDQTFLKYKSAEKTNFANYYTWTLSMSCNQLLELQVGLPADYIRTVKAGYSNEYQLKVVLLFNKNNNQIEKIKCEWPFLDMENDQLLFCTLEVAKFSGKITPQWYTDYIASQNN